MANKDVYIIEIDADGTPFIKELEKVEKETKKTGKKIEDDLGGGFDKVGFAVGKLKGAFVALTAAIGAGQLFKSAIDGAIQQEEAVNKLNTALKLNGLFSETASRDLQNFATGLQQVTTVGDETTLEMLGLALAFTKNASEAKKLTQAAIDFSAFTGQDLQTSIEQLGKTLSGSAGRLGDYASELKNLSKEQLKAGAGVDIIAAKFRGAGEAQATTFGGALKQLTNNFGDMLESIGQFITQSTTLITTIKLLSNAFAGLATSISRTRIEFFGTDSEKAALNVELLKETIAKTEAQVTRYKELMASAKDETSFFGLITEKASTAQDSYRARLAKLEPVLAGMKARYEELTKAQKDAADSGRNVVDLESVRKAREEFDKTITQIKDQRLQLQIASAQGILDETERTAALESLKAARITQIHEQFTARIAELAQQRAEKQFVTAEQYNTAIVESVKLRDQQITNLTDEYQKTQLAKSKAFSDSIGSTLVSGIAGSMQALGAALVNGEDAWGAFAKSVIGVIGDLMIQVGTSIILQAEAIKALQAAIATFAWPAALAAGLALIALGGAFKAISGKGASGSVPAAAPTGGATGPVATTPVAGPDLNQAANGQQININVEGTVLDPRSVGQQIARILQDTFESNSATVNYA